MNRWLKYLVATCSTALLVACGGSDDPPPPGNIAVVAQQNGFNALLAAATKAGLAPALTDNAASLTVFAPTDEAFTNLAGRLGFADATAMVDALPAEALASILTYHVLPTKQVASALVAGGPTQATLYSFEESPVSLSLDTAAGVVITDAVLTQATVSKANVAASNGVIHVIDKVLIPPGVLNIVQMAQANPLFDSLVGAVVAANLQGALSGTGPFTVFAPTNGAFAAARLTGDLTNVLTYHVLPGQVLAAAIPFDISVPTLQGASLTINAGPPLTITDYAMSFPPAKIIATDVRASNGVIHVIDKVLDPSAP